MSCVFDYYPCPFAIFRSQCLSQPLLRLAHPAITKGFLLCLAERDVLYVELI
jgi:hypothetical protein